MNHKTLDFRAIRKNECYYKSNVCHSKICNRHKERTTVSNYKYCLTIYIEQVNFVLQQLYYGVNFSYCSLLSI